MNRDIIISTRACAIYNSHETITPPNPGMRVRQVLFFPGDNDYICGPGIIIVWEYE